MKKNQNSLKEIILIGSGIMSATIAFIMKKLEPDSKIVLYEKLDTVAAESTNASNNAGTGHSAFCELNYTPKQEDGTINIDKALKIAESFEVSRQFWSFLKKQKIISDEVPFIKKVPHLSLVWGENNISFLKQRHETMIKNALFEDMKFSEDFEEIKTWLPLLMKDRDSSEKMGATKMDAGTDVNFDLIAISIIDYLKTCERVEICLNHHVKDLTKQRDGSWKVEVKDLSTGKRKTEYSKFVFIGAGGGAISLLQKSGIKEGIGYAGFPVSGMFLRCLNEDIIKQHDVKVYGKAAKGSPPMSMPHLDNRRIEGKESLLFGPFAGISTKFLKKGSYWDWFKSWRFHNIGPMFAVGRNEFGLIKYLYGQVLQTKKGRLKTLKIFYPEATSKDWQLYTAGQRVQIMKKDSEKGGVLKLGTEIVNSRDGSLAALLGASPGASTSVSIILEVLDKCFAEQMKLDDWKTKIKEMIPSYGESLINNEELCRKTRKETAKALGLDE